MITFIKNTSKVLLVLAFLGLGISFTANQVFESRDLYSLTLNAGEGGKFSNNDSILMINNIKPGTKFNEVQGLETPKKEECEFIKWTINDQDIDSNYKITSNIVAKAHFTNAPIHEYTVTLKSLNPTIGYWGEEGSPKDTYELPGKHSAIRLSDLNWLKIKINLDPSYDIKWYADQERKHELNDITLIEKDTTLYADFVYGKISVTFIENNSHPYEEGSVTHFEKLCSNTFNDIEKPVITQPTGFEGWDDVFTSLRIVDADPLPFYFVPNSENRTRLLWVMPMFKGEMSVVFTSYDYSNDISGYIEIGGNKSFFKTIECSKGTTWGSFRTTHASDIPLPKLDKPLDDEYEREDNNPWYFANGNVIEDTHSFEYTTLLYPKYVIKKAKNFLTDSWTVLLNEFNTKGYNNITEDNTHPYYSTYVDNGETFVGLERTVHLNGFDKDYKVRVIGDCQDEYYTDVEKTQKGKTALTFEFEEVIYNAPYSDNRNNNYLTSIIRNYSLNLSLLNNMPNVLKDSKIGIKSSIKRTLIGMTYPNEYSYDTHEDRLFLLSMNEMNFKAHKLLYKDEHIQEEGFLNEYNKHLAAYQYYESINNRNELATRIKTDSQGKPARYWLRSPDFTSKLFAWTISPEGTLGETADTATTMVDEGMGIAPAFAIGVQSI